MRNNLLVGIEKIAETLSGMSLENFKDICGGHVHNAIIIYNLNRSKMDECNAAEIVEINESSEHARNLSISNEDNSEKIKNIFQPSLTEFRIDRGKKALFGLNSYRFVKSLKIVCNEKITGSNIHLMCHILNNITVDLSSKFKQVLYINMRRTVDHDIINRQILWFFENHSSISDTADKKNTFQKINVTIKKRGSRTLTTATIDIKSIMQIANLQDTIGPKAMMDSIHNIISLKTETKNIANNVQLAITDDLTLKNNAGVSFVSIRYFSDIKSIRLTHATAILNSDNIKVDMYLKSRSMNSDDANTMTYDLINPIESFNEFSTQSRVLNQRYIAPILKNFLSNMQFYHLGICRNIYFRFGGLERYHHDDYLLHDGAFALEEPILPDEKMTDIEMKINKFYTSMLDIDRIYKIETNLFDFLRREHCSLWRNATKDLMSIVKFDKERFEKMIYKNLVYRYHLNPHNDHAIPSILSKNYKILILAIKRQNSNIMLYLVRKDLEPVMSNLPFATLMDFYMDETNEIYHYDDDFFDLLYCTNHLGINAVCYVVQTMVTLKFNMTGDFIAQFRRRKNMFIKTFYRFVIPNFTLEMPNDINFNPGPYNNSKEVTLVRNCYKNIFEREIEIILHKMEYQIRKIKINRYIRVTATSLDPPDSTDIDNVDKIVEILRQSE